jgi:hypothetical protein
MLLILAGDFLQFIQQFLPGAEVLGHQDIYQGLDGKGVGGHPLLKADGVARPAFFGPKDIL